MCKVPNYLQEVYIHNNMLRTFLICKYTHTAAVLLNEVTKGHILSRRERLLMIRTISDLIRMVPFIDIHYLLLLYRFHLHLHDIHHQSRNHVIIIHLFSHSHHCTESLNH